MSIDHGDKQLTELQLAALAKQAGFPDDQLATAVAVAMAESSGYSTNRNSIGASGLWQILESAHGDLFSKYKGQWKDPLINAEMAYTVWKDAGASWRPWEAFTNGAYLQYADGAAKAVQQLKSGGSSSIGDILKTVAGITSPLYGLKQGAQAVGTDLTAPIKALASDFDSFSKFITALLIPSTWVRIASGVFGFGFLLIALYLLATTATRKEG